MIEKRKLSATIAERLIVLRREDGQGISQKKIALLLEEMVDDSFGEQAYKGYENPNRPKGQAAGMSVQKLVAIAKYYGVSTDYILGLREEKTPSASIQGVCETTGLSEDAVNWIANLDEVTIKYLDMLLNSETFRLMLSYLELAPPLNTSVKLFQYTVDQISKGNPPPSFELVDNDMNRLEELPIVDINEKELAESYYRHAETAELRRDVHEYKFSQLATELYKQFSSLKDYPRYNKNEEVE